MTPAFQKYGQIVIAIIGALAIIGTALWTKGTEHNDNAWLYAFSIWFFFFLAFEVYSARKRRDNH